MIDDQSENSELLQRSLTGDEQALHRLFDIHRDRLRRMVQLRMDSRMRARVDPSDVLQEAFLDAWTGLPSYQSKSSASFYLWLRTIAIRKLHALHRRHLGTQTRDATREVSIDGGPLPEASTEYLAAQLIGRLTSPSQKAIRAELQLRVQEALNTMEPMDREVLALRHFERLSNIETAEVIGIQETAASNRYVRALERLQQKLMDIPGFLDR